MIIARFGMLECGVNHKGTLSYECNSCKTADNEEHRLNHCIKFRDVNYCDKTEKSPFNLIYSNDVNIIRTILEKINNVWNVSMGHGAMR